MFLVFVQQDTKSTFYKNFLNTSRAKRKHLRTTEEIKAKSQPTGRSLRTAFTIGYVTALVERSASLAASLPACTLLPGSYLAVNE